VNTHLHLDYRDILIVCQLVIAKRGKWKH
jgi:hypothetical protein